MNRNLKKESFDHFEFKKVSKNHSCFRCCNLCGELFSPHSRFERYCNDCKKEDELFKYGNWLPELNDQLATKFL